MPVFVKAPFILWACLVCFVSMSQRAWAEDKATLTADASSVASVSELMDKLIKRVQKRQFDWDISLFVKEGWKTRGQTVNNLPLIYWSCGDKKAINRSLILSAVHGDEVTPVYFGFRLVEWLKARPEVCKDKFIVVAPIVNPDGFLRYRRGTRTNYNKVDLNRNFNTPDWLPLAHKKWRSRLINGKPQRRYYPGDTPDSEPEIHFQKWLIDEFHPTKVMSVHAPLRLLDFDGPTTELNRIFSEEYISSVEAMKIELKASSKFLRYQAYGSFPGSLGNYAGRQKGIPTVTLELPSTRASKAPYYFGMVEKSTRVFIDFDLTATAQQKVSLKESENKK